MNISLKPDEKLYINGAVIRADRKVSIELLNDVTFLLESHVLQAHEATTPLRQIYFVIQVMLMDPASANTSIALSGELIEAAIRSFRTPQILEGLQTIGQMVERSRPLDAMKSLRALYPLEREEMFPSSAEAAYS